MSEKRYVVKDRSEEVKTDNIVQPKHYQPSNMFSKQPIEMMYETMSSDLFIGYCLGNVFKYVMRYKSKNGIEDLKKAQQYLEFLIRAEDGKSPVKEVI